MAINIKACSQKKVHSCIVEEKTFNMKDCPLELMIRINVLIKT